MSQLTRAEFKDLWIKNYTPSESDFDDLWDSFFNLLDDTGPTVDSLEFNTAAGVTVGEGEMAWNDTSKTVDLGLPGDVTMQIGQEIPLWVKNESGSDVDNGDMVYVAGSTGVHLVVGLADASDLTKSSQVGMVTTPAGIANNGFGFVTRFGAVRGVNTTGIPEGEVWSEGDVLYLSTTPGELTNAAPGTPDYTVEVGLVVNKNSSQGVIGVDPKQPHSADVALGTSDLVGPTQNAVKTYVDGTFSAITEGYQIFPSGLIVQWGTPTLSAAPEAVTLPIAFPTAGLNGMACDFGTPTQSVGVAAISTTTITIDTVSGSNPVVVSYIAIGY